MRTVLLLLFGLLVACSSPAPVTPEATAPEAVTPAPSSSSWPGTPGWHVVATLPGLQRVPRGIAGDRRGRTVAVLGARGRRVVLVTEGRPPLTIKLALNVEGIGVAWDGEQVVVVDRAGEGSLVRLDRAGAVTSTVPLESGLTRLQSRPDGALVATDGLGRPDPAAEPAWRGVPGPAQAMVRATDSEAGPLLVVSRPGAASKKALLASIPRARDPRVIGLEPSSDPLVGWLATWTGEPVEQALHLVRFDGQGRVLQTIPGPDLESGADLRASMRGRDQVVLGVPSKAGLQLHLLVPGGGSGKPLVELGATSSP